MARRGIGVPFAIPAAISDSAGGCMRGRARFRAARPGHCDALPVEERSGCGRSGEEDERARRRNALFLERATSVVLDNGTTRRELFRESSALAMSGYKGREVRVTQASCDESRKYWLWSKAIQVANAPDELQAAVLKLPGKWPQIKEVTVSIAVRVGEGPDQGIFSIFLPTPLRTGCATHINAAFCGDMSRTHIDSKTPTTGFSSTRRPLSRSMWWRMSWRDVETTKLSL